MIVIVIDDGPDSFISQTFTITGPGDPIGVETPIPLPVLNQPVIMPGQTGDDGLVIYLIYNYGWIFQLLLLWLDVVIITFVTLPLPHCQFPFPHCDQ